jgi:hypothetical protein
MGDGSDDNEDSEEEEHSDLSEEEDADEVVDDERQEEPPSLQNLHIAEDDEKPREGNEDVESEAESDGERDGEEDSQSSSEDEDGERKVRKRRPQTRERKDVEASASYFHTFLLLTPLTPESSISRVGQTRKSQEIDREAASREETRDRQCPRSKQGLKDEVRHQKDGEGCSGLVRVNDDGSSKFVVMSG